MNFQSLDIHLRSSMVWRAVGVSLCCWIAGIVSLAGWAAYNDGLELYRWTMLALLLIGAPTSVAAIAYAASLLGRQVRKAILFLITLLCIAIGTMFGYDAHQASVRAKEQAAVVAKRAAAKVVQDHDDWQQFGTECVDTCTRLSDHSSTCAPECSERRGDEARRAKWKAENASCATQCAADPNPFCDLCEMPEEENW